MSLIISILLMKTKKVKIKMQEEDISDVETCSDFRVIFTKHVFKKGFKRLKNILRCMIQPL